MSKHKWHSNSSKLVNVEKNMTHKNPWDIGSLYDFLNFNCPSCPYKDNSKQEFVNHACRVHPEAGPYLRKIQDDSISDIHIPEYEFIKKESKNEIENEEAFSVIAESDRVKVEHYKIKSEFENDNFENEQFSYDNFEENEDESYVQEDFDDAYYDEEEQEPKLKEENFKCKICNEVFSKKSSLSRHKKKFHSDGKFDDLHCSICDKFFIRKISLKNHNEIFHAEDSEEQQHCTICEKNFKNKYFLYAHNRKFHPDVKNYQCEWCDEKFSQFRNLKKHVLLLHEEKSNNSTVQCEKCSQMVTKYYYKIHMARVHPEECEDQIDLLEKIKCEKCDLWIQKLGMKTHIRSMHSDDPCICDFCGNAYGNQLKLKHHIYDVHKEKVQARKYNTEKTQKIECSQCNKMIRKGNIEKHILSCQKKYAKIEIANSNRLESNSPQKLVHVVPVSVKVKCEYCGKSYARAALKQHIKSVHEKVKDFQCPKCGMAFSEKRSLKNHDSTAHSEIRNFKCDQCEKTYKLSQHLKDHIKVVHEGRKDYVCPTCGKAFGTSKHLKRHCDTVHEKIKRWECDYCTNAFGQSHELKKHLQNCRQRV